MKAPNLLCDDLDYILQHTANLWEELRDQNIFITGGTGFFGCWFLESFLWANDHYNLNASATVLTRNTATFIQKCPQFNNQSALNFLEGDVRNFKFPLQKFNYIIHAATDASAQLNAVDPLLMLETIVYGTWHTLEFAKECQAKEILYLSSGAVYGKQPSEITHITEDFIGTPETYDAYAHGKRMAEHLCLQFAKQHQLSIKIARCFAFVGPHLPLNIHYAIGNFLQNVLKSETIQINGDGTPYRSYLYAADAMIALWKLLFNGQSALPYNIGSKEEYSISELAHHVATLCNPALPINIAKPPSCTPPARYVPDTQRVMTELGLPPPLSLPEALKRTLRWHQSIKQEYNLMVMG